MKPATIDERRERGYFPYYKLQWFDQTTLAWMDVQRRFTTPAQAATAGQSLVPPAGRGQQLRVMEVSRSGRQPWQPPTTRRTTRRRTTMGKATIHFGPDWKGKIEAGYWPKISRGVQEADGAHVIDFYGRRYALKPTRGAKGEFDVVKDLGPAVRQPRGGRGPRKPAEAISGAQASAGTPGTPKGRQRRSATPPRASQAGPTPRPASAGRPKREAAASQPRTGAKAKAGDATATDSSAAGRGSRRTARKQSAAA